MEIIDGNYWSGGAFVDGFHWWKLLMEIIGLVVKMFWSVEIIVCVNSCLTRFISQLCQDEWKLYA